ncbi:WD40 repeat-like protein [Hymenopellis radicata]|nr:WD40 repeat-like protein [Hymenopellis radicata]
MSARQLRRAGELNARLNVFYAVFGYVKGSLKRLLTFSQTKYPPEDVSQLMGNLDPVHCSTLPPVLQGLPTSKMTDIEPATATNAAPVEGSYSKTLSTASPNEPVIVDSHTGNAKHEEAVEPMEGADKQNDTGVGPPEFPDAASGSRETASQRGRPGENTRLTSRQDPVLGATKTRDEGPEDKQSCGCKKDGRNLVVCIDGTSNQFGTKNSNVVEFYSLIKKEEANQRTWYNSGIGTYAKPSWKSLSYLRRTVSHKIDMAIAWNFERIVCGAYRWLSDNYEPGDCIFLFGFSRGAFQARVISAMIDKVGLIHKGNEMQIPFAYELYAEERDIELCKNFKNTFSRKDVKVHFVGAWDTVSSIGIFRDPKLLPGTTDGMEHVCYFRHALALDERRVKFLPEYANGGLMEPPRKTPDVKEVWFAGTHSDIGGGNVENPDMSRKMPPLRWMVSEAKQAGLRMDELRSEFLSLRKLDIIESLTWPWWSLEVLPLKRLAYTGQSSTTMIPHLGRGRRICKGQKIDLSVFLTKENWAPKVRGSLDPTKIRRTDQAEDGNHNGQMPLEFHSDPQWRDDLLSALIDLMLEPESSERLGSKILDAFNKEPTSLRIRHRQTDLVTASPLIKNLLSGENREDGETARQFLRGFTVPIIQTAQMVFCTVFSKDSKYIFHGGKDGHLRVSDAYTGEAVAEVPTTGSVLTITFSTDGGRCVVGGWQGDGGGFLQVFNWNEEQRQLSEAESRLFECRLYHNSVGFLPNQDPDQEEDIVVLQKGNILVWNVSKDPVKLMEGGRVNLIVFSPRGDTMIAYSRQSSEFRVWSAATRKCLFTLPVRVDNWVSHIMIACSTNGELLATGFLPENGLIRIWDAKSGEECRQLRGHTDGVFSVCFSPNSNLLVSGSADKTVKVWDVTTCKLLETFVGHEDWVWSVAFSPDGKRIVSGGRDWTVRVWDIENIASSNYGQLDE